MEDRITYRFLGIPVWSVTRHRAVVDDEALYQKFATRFNAEISAAIQRAQTP